MAKIKTNVTNKNEGSADAELDSINTAAAKELSEGGGTLDAEVIAAAEASQTAAQNKADADGAKAEKQAKLKNIQIDRNVQRAVAGESAELIAAVKADAEARGKNFSVCPISGVLVVS